LNISRKYVTGLLGGIAASIFISSAQAAPITIPVGLNPGDTYRLAFVTSTTTTATTNNISFYNNFVNNIGLAATGITGWTAIASVNNTDARDNTNTNFTTDTGTAIYLLDGTTKIADHNADLWDSSIDAALNIDESGSSVVNNRVWSGTASDGIKAPSFGLGGGADGTVLLGLSAISQTGWIFNAIDNIDNNPGSLAHLYAISGVLTVAEEPTAVPAPAGLTILGLGLIGLARMRRKRAA